jgi:hypothetical protein
MTEHDEPTQRQSKITGTRISTESGPAPENHEDTTSDPALSDDPGHDWSDEGGATTSGPATDTDTDPGTDTDTGTETGHH